MPRPRRDVRRTLLSALNAFLEGTPASLERGHELVNATRATFRLPALALTLDELVYGHYLHALTDWICYAAPDYLREARDDVLGRTRAVHRTYLHRDFRPQFTSTERTWFDRLRALQDELARFPFSGEDLEVVCATYSRDVEVIEQLAVASPPPDDPGDEMLHHLVLREATALLTSIDLVPGAIQSYPYLCPVAPFNSYIDYSRTQRPNPGIHMRLPDGSCALPAADRLLKAIANEGWAIITYQHLPSSNIISFH